MTRHEVPAGAPGQSRAESAEAFDAVELEVFRQLFAAAAEEMGVRLMRSAYSPNIKERRDFSCALFDVRGDMIAQAAHIPVHLGSAPLSVKAILERFPADGMRPDDRYIVNDPFAGGTHLPDITVVAPCFVDGRGSGPRFFVATRAHHADVGGTTPGSLPISTHIDQEGVRIPPSRLDDELIESICRQTRTPEERRGDLRAQLAAIGVGIERLSGLCVSYGADRIDDAGQALQDYAARFVRRLLADLPDGTFTFKDVMDDDGHAARDVAIRCTIRIEGDRAVVDFRDSDDQAPGPINAVRAITLSAVLYAFRCLTAADVPSNSGVLEPIEVRTRPGSVVDAQPPAAVAGGNVETSQRIVDVLFGALAQALPDRVPAASCGSMNNVTIGGDDARQRIGHDQADDTGRHGSSFAYYETIAGGAGAGPESDGGGAVHTHMTNTLNTPVEALERDYPFRVEAYALRRGSGGAGRHRGGDGLRRVYAFDTHARVTLLTDRRRHAPYGVAGGMPGAPGVNRLHRADGSATDLPGKCSIHVEPGDRLELLTPGGGGWGHATDTLNQAAP